MHCVLSGSLLCSKKIQYDELGCPERFRFPLARQHDEFSYPQIFPLARKHDKLSYQQIFPLAREHHELNYPVSHFQSDTNPYWEPRCNWQNRHMQLRANSNASELDLHARINSSNLRTLSRGPLFPNVSSASHLQPLVERTWDSVTNLMQDVAS